MLTFLDFDFNKFFESSKDPFGKLSIDQRTIKDALRRNGFGFSNIPVHIDEINNGDTLRLQLAIPGLLEDGLDISVNEAKREIKISGKSDFLGRKEGEDFAKFNYKYSLGFEINGIESTSANYTRGILCIFLEKSKTVGKLKSVKVKFND